VPPAATDPVDKLSAYLYRFIWGSAKRPIVTAEAREDPDSVANPKQAAIFAETSPLKMPHPALSRSEKVVEYTQNTSQFARHRVPQDFH